MSVEIRVPSLGELVTEATVARWFKQVGDPVNADEPIVELETDKVTLEFNAPASGTLAEITVEEGGEVEVGALLGSISEDGGATGAAAPRPARRRAGGEAASRRRRRPWHGALSPAVRKLLEEHGLDPATIEPTGPKGNLTKGDVLAAVEAEAAGAGRRRPAAPSAGAGERAAAAERRPEPRGGAEPARRGPSRARGRDSRHAAPAAARRGRAGRRRRQPAAGRRRARPPPRPAARRARSGSR